MRPSGARRRARARRLRARGRGSRPARWSPEPSRGARLATIGVAALGLAALGVADDGAATATAGASPRHGSTAAMPTPPTVTVTAAEAIALPSQPQPAAVATDLPTAADSTSPGGTSICGATTTAPSCPRSRDQPCAATSTDGVGGDCRALAINASRSCGACVIALPPSLDPRRAARRAARAPPAPTSGASTPWAASCPSPSRSRARSCPRARP